MTEKTNMEIVTLTFEHSWAGTTTLLASKDSCAPIAAWYGAYHAGDEYTIRINGELIEKDLNGEITL